MGALCSRTADALPPDAVPNLNTTTNTGTNVQSTDGHHHPLSNLRFGSSSTTKTAPRRESEKRGMRQGLVHNRPNASVWDNYSEVKVIGHGMTGKVYMVQHKSTKEKYALKCMEVRKIDPELIQDLRNEIEVLKLQDHPNVIKLYEYYEDKDNLYLILEYADGGELFDRLHEQKGSRYTEAEAARLMFRMCAAIGYIHYMGVTHRDLKLENFIFESKAADSNIKLIDFGLSSKYGSSLRRMSTMVGTPYYIAPEVLNQTENSSASRGYTNACDVWSLGVIAYMLLSGTPPFKGRRDREVLQAVRRGKYTLSGPRWENISEDAKDFIRHLLVYNPMKRMTAEQALKHPWLQKAKHETESHALDPEILTTLRDFSRMTAFKRAAMEAIAFSMSAPSISHLREAFSRLDTEQSGFVNMKEFLKVMLQAGMSTEEASMVFRQIDQDNSGAISYTEFLAATLPKRFWLSRERVRDAFTRLDMDNTGYITPGNLRDVMGDDWTPELAHQLFDEIGMLVGSNHPGQVSVDELTDWFLGEFTKDTGSNKASSSSTTATVTMNSNGSIDNNGVSTFVNGYPSNSSATTSDNNTSYNSGSTVTKYSPRLTGNTSTSLGNDGTVMLGDTVPPLLGSTVSSVTNAVAATTTTLPVKTNSSSSPNSKPVLLTNTNNTITGNGSIVTSSLIVSSSNPTNTNASSSVPSTDHSSGSQLSPSSSSSSSSSSSVSTTTAHVPYPIDTSPPQHSLPSDERKANQGIERERLLPSNELYIEQLDPHTGNDFTN